MLYNNRALRIIKVLPDTILGKDFVLWNGQEESGVRLTEKSNLTDMEDERRVKSRSGRRQKVKYGAKKTKVES